jgi:hypothetical protein
MMDYTLLQEILAEEKTRDLTRIDAHRAEALEMTPHAVGIRALVAGALLRLATALDSSIVRPATAR